MRRRGRDFIRFAVLALLIGVAAGCSSAETAGTAPPGASATEPVDSASTQSSASSSVSASPSVSSPNSVKPETKPAKDDHGHHAGKPSPSPSPPPSPKPSSPSPTPSGSDDSVKQVETVTVEIKGFAFSPDEIQIPPGSKVKFINRDDVDHSAVADDGSFDTGMIGKDESKTVSFDKQGTFTYYCNPHTGMTGKIVVKSK